MIGIWASLANCFALPCLLGWGCLTLQATENYVWVQRRVPNLAVATPVCLSKALAVAYKWKKYLPAAQGHCWNFSSKGLCPVWENPVARGAAVGLSLGLGSGGWGSP